MTATQRARRPAVPARVADVIDDAARPPSGPWSRRDGFAEWFARISPLEEIGGLRIGSRPARRGLSRSAVGLEDLRAIPWVFAWSQTRVNLPGWFGLGSGLAAVVESGATATGRAWRSCGGRTRSGRCSTCCSTTRR